jgi:hypothetical protein
LAQTQIEIIGAGFGRTGTLSLKTALEILGYAKCYPIEEVFSHPWHAWSRVKAMDTGRADWPRLFQGYRASVDWPGCTFYRQLSAAYPQTKVILTVRDPEKWYAAPMHPYKTSCSVSPLTRCGCSLPGLSWG